MVYAIRTTFRLKENRPDITVKIFEAAERLGGRVYTHRFSEEENQYFEAGAMRLPDVSWQKPVFDLITYLNSKLPNFKINLIPYHYSCPSGNRVYMNGTKQTDGNVMSVDYANNHLDELGFPPEAGATDEAGKLLQEAINPVIEELRDDFAFALKKYDSMTLHYYLSKELLWTEEKINFVESMSSQTNELRNGLVDQAILNSDFSGQVVTKWRTIRDGMCRLPEAMEKVIGKDDVVLQAPVESLKDLESGGVEVGYAQPNQNLVKETFDAVIVALPPSAARMIPTKPKWSVAFDHGLRSIHFQPLYKIGLHSTRRMFATIYRRTVNNGPSMSLGCLSLVWNR